MVLGGTGSCSPSLLIVVVQPGNGWSSSVLRKGKARPNLPMVLSRVLTHVASDALEVTILLLHSVQDPATFAHPGHQPLNLTTFEASFCL